MRKKLQGIIFGTTSKSGKTFDIVLLILILISVLIVMFESVPSWRDLLKKNSITLNGALPFYLRLNTF